MRYDRYHDGPLPPSWTPTSAPNQLPSRLRERHPDPPEAAGGDSGARSAEDRE